MRRQTELKIVPHEETETARSSSVPSVRETRGTPLLEGAVFDTLDKMERLMHDSLSRALGGFGPLHLGQLFDRFSAVPPVVPAVDIYDEGKFLVVKAELPGMERDDVTIRLLDNALVISGEKRTERTSGDKGFYRVERSSGSFERSITLPGGVDGDRAAASFTNGVLEVRIPKNPEQHLGRKIAIK